MAEDMFGFIGTVIDNRHRIDEMIAEGGFGVVYRGFHLSFEQPLAVKCLKMPGHFTTEAKRLFLQKFREEGKHLAKLCQHPSVVQVFDFGIAQSPTQESVPYLALEWLEGHDLEDLIDVRRAAGHGPFTEAEALRLLRPAVDALAFAHSLGIAHRDIKPANLFMAKTARGEILKVLDFGIAKAMQEGETATQATTKTTSGFNPFSPKYGAPEQFRGLKFGSTGPWTDVHALGLVLVELVTGMSAYEGEEMADYLLGAIADERPTPRTLGAPASDAFEKLCAKALARSPAERLRSCRELLTALDAALAEIGPAGESQPCLPAASRPAPPVSATPVELAGVETGAFILCQELTGLEPTPTVENGAWPASLPVSHAPEGYATTVPGPTSLPPASDSVFAALARLHRRFFEKYPERATGGRLALSGCYHQLLLVLRDGVRAWLDAAQTAPSEPAVLTERLSDMLQKSDPEQVLVTPVKLTQAAGSLHAALQELWDIHRLALVEEPALAARLSYRAVSSSTTLTGTQRSIAGWTPSDGGSEAELSDFRSRLGATTEPDPGLDLLSLLANELRALDPLAYIDRWLGLLLPEAANVPDDGSSWQRAATQICSDLQKLKAEKHGRPAGIYFWSPADRAPDTVREGPVLMGQLPRVKHLRDGYFAAREPLLSELSDKARQCITGYYEVGDESYRLPVLWITGRSGSGKSVLLLQLLADLHAHHSGHILWLANSIAKLPEAVRWATHFGASRPTLIAVDDPCVPGGDSEGDRAWLEALEAVEIFRQRGETRALPFIICCGPPEQLRRAREDLCEHLAIESFVVPPADSATLASLRRFYKRRTKKEPPDVGDDNVLLVQTFFEWKTGLRLPESAKRFEKRILQEGGDTLHDTFALMLALNRLYVGYPKDAFDAAIAPAQRDLIQQLLHEHHLTEDSEGAGGGIRLAHPHLSNVIYDSWFPEHRSETRRDHLQRAVAACLSSRAWTPAQRTAALWAIAREKRRPAEELEAGGRRRIDEATICQALTEIYKALPQLCPGAPRLLWLLPVWLELSAHWPELALEPCPVDTALELIEQATGNETGLSLTCQKLLQHCQALSESRAAAIKERIHDLLARTGPEHGSWGFVWGPLLQAHPKDADLQQLGQKWLRAAPPEHRSWSFIWEALHKVQPRDEELMQLGRSWLSAAPAHRSWGFVWEALCKAHPQDESLQQLGRQWLTAAPPEHGSWGFVWGALWRAHPQDEELRSAARQWLEQAPPEHKGRSWVERSLESLPST